MTFSDIRNKLIKNIWIIIFVVGVSNLSLLSVSTNPSYLSSITVGLNINNQQYQNILNNSTNFAQNTYDQSLETFSSYLSSRFSSPELQYKISESASLNAKIDAKKPFYEVKNQSAGFVNISYSASTKEQGEKFVSSVNDVMLSVVINEWNRDRLQLFKIDLTNKNTVEFNNAVIEVKPPLQNQILPTIVGLVIGVAIALLMPYLSFKKLKQEGVLPTQEQYAVKK